LDLILTLDISGSMAGSKLKLLIEAVKLIMNDLSPKDRLALVVFNGKAERLTKLLCLNNRNKKKLSKILNKIKASGGTNIAAAMDVSLAILKGRRYFNPVTSICLLSDG